jgi:ribosome-associated toxin RatA of RatAB toxin-antitoxin module
MQVTRTALIPHTAMDMYRLVHDVASYPLFLSWCSSSEVHEQDHGLQVASLSVSMGGIRQQFTTRNRLVPGQQLSMSLVEGPFRSLSGEWQFVGIGSQGSKVSLDLRFEFSSGVVSAAFRRSFARITERMVRDFCERADRIYAGQGGDG